MLALWVAWSLAAEPGEACVGGRVVEPDTLGHCCWSGQAWNGARCVGLPLACPPGARVSPSAAACVTEGCRDGLGLVDGLHCCWPGQAWNATSEMCDGPVACPDGYVPAAPAGEGACAPAGQRMAGLLAAI